MTDDCAPIPDGAPPGIPTRAFIHELAGPLQDLAHELGFADLRLVGSVARGTARATSDVDFLVQVGSTLRGAAYFGAMETFRVHAEHLVGRSVDVIDLDSVTDGEVRTYLLDEARPL